MGASALYDLMSELLAVCEQALAQTTAGAPDRRYVGHGLPAIDCEQLVVSTYSVAEADVSPRTLPLDRAHRVKTGTKPLQVLVVSIVRCYPGPTLDKKQQPMLPKAAAIEAASKTLSEDAWQLWNAIRSANRLGAFQGLCSELAMDPITPMQPSGGFAGWTLPIEVAVPGFPVTFP